MERSDAVRSAVERFAECFAHADVEGFAAAIADEAEAFVIGTQRSTSGRDEWLENFGFLVDKGLVLPDGSGLRLELHELRGFAEDSFGWAAGWATFVFSANERLPSRLTAVLRREGDDWKLLHAHFSVPVPDALALKHVEEWMQQLGQRPATTSTD